MLQNRLFLALASRSGCGAAIADAVACSSIVLCNSASADRILVAASVENPNAAALLGRTLGSQTGVIEWLVKNVFGHWGGFDVGLVMVSRPCAAIHLPLRGCTLPVSDSTVARINAKLNAMDRPIRYQRDLARAFP